VTKYFCSGLRNEWKHPGCPRKVLVKIINHTVETNRSNGGRARAGPSREFVMTLQSPIENRILLGDPVPWFSAPQISGGAFDLHVSAGRWVVLAFMGSPQNPRVEAEITQLLQQADLLADDHLVVACLLTAPPEDISKFAATAGNKLLLLADDDGAIHRAFGALAMPRTIVLDPMLRAIADLATPARNIGVLPSRSISTAISTAATSCAPNSAARPTARRTAAPWCFPAARCTKSPPSPAASATRSWRFSTPRKTRSSAKRIMTGCMTASGNILE
jgi:peroxiredoxin